MSKPKKQEERQWRNRKEDQHPHGEVKSLKELSEGKEETK